MNNLDIENLRIQGHYSYPFESRQKFKEKCKKILKGNVKKTDNISTQPTTFKLKLWDHQLSMLNAMENYEKDILKYTRNVDMGVLSNKVGSGKSAIILALINNNSNYINRKKLLMKHNPFKSGIDMSRGGGSRSFPTMYSPEYIIKSNLIVVPHGIFSQWYSYIKEITELSVYGIDRRKKILSDYKKYSEYDIVLCKSTMYNSLVTSIENSNYRIDHLINPEFSTIINRHNLQQSGLNLERICHRNIQKPSLNYGATYFLQGISTYKSQLEDYRKELEKNIETVSRINTNIIENDLRCSEGYYIEKYNETKGVVWSRLIFDEADSINIPKCGRMNACMTWLITSNLHNLLFNQGATDSSYRILVSPLGYKGFINQTITENFSFGNRNNLRHFTFKNPDSFIQESLDDLIPDYQEIKIECHTPHELRILRGVVSNEIIQMINGGDIYNATISLGCKMDTKENLLKNFTDTLEENLEKTKKKIKKLNSRLRGKKIRETPEEMETVRETIKNSKKEISSIKTKLKSISDKIENAENEVCPVCYDNTSNPTIVPCCKNVFCLECITKWNSTKQNCPMCRHKLSPTDFSVMSDIKREEEGRLRTKLEELKILLKEKTGNKVLIFSEFDNSFNDARTFLGEEEIGFDKLSGNAGRINNILRRYRDSEDKQVLLLNAKHFGSGLNLQMTTDIIFYHRMSVDMEKQVIGRGQRVGRTCPLKIHYLCYENEMI